MPQAKKPKETKKAGGIKVILMPDTTSSGDEDGDQEYEDESGGMYLDKDDIQLIYNALRVYKPAEDEKQRYELLLEEFDEILTVDYNMPPDMN